MTPEGLVKLGVKLLLKRYGKSGKLWTFWPVPSGYGRSTVDLIGVANGRPFAVEVKRPKAVPTARQAAELAALAAAGATVFVIDGTDYGPFERFLEEAMSCPSASCPQPAS